MEPKVGDKRSASAPKRETGRSCSQGGNTLDCRHECRREGYVASLLATSSSVSRTSALTPNTIGSIQRPFDDQSSHPHRSRIQGRSRGNREVLRQRAEEEYARSRSFRPACAADRNL